MPSPTEIVAQMRQALSISEPDLDTSVGTVIRKILDVVSEGIAEAYVDRYLLSYQYDIDAKAGADLDAFVALFGFTRQAARRASGTVLIQRDTPATASFSIPAGTQFSTTGNVPIITQMISSAVFPRGATSISVTVQASVGGTDGNVSANSLTRWLSVISGIVAVTNPSALTGGMDAESDAQLRERFKRSIFRSLAGTEDMYLGIAMDDISVTAAKVLGPAERWREQIEVISGVATSTISNNLTAFTVTAATNANPSVVTLSKTHNLVPGEILKISGAVGNTAINGTWRVDTTPAATTITLRSLDGTTVVAGNGVWSSGGTVVHVDRCKWVYPTGYVFGSNIDNGQILTPGVHYSFDPTTIPPTVTSLDANNCPDGIYDLSFNYVPMSSRNDPPQGISNRVDVYANGEKPTTATETALFDGRVLVSASTSSPYSYARFRRESGAYPATNNALVRLSLTPVVDLPNTIDLGNTTLTIDTDYWKIREVGNSSGAWDSFDGIEVSTAAIQGGTLNIVSSTDATPIVLNIGAHAFDIGQTVLVAGHTTNTHANGLHIISAKDATHITLQDTTATGGGAGGNTGTVALVSPALVEYEYNAMPRDVQSAIEGWRMLTTDVVTHYGSPVSLKIYAAVILRPGNTVFSIQAAIDNAVGQYLAGIEFGGTLQISDLLNVMGDVAGVDAVRLTNATDMPFASVNGATNATPIVVSTVSGHGFVTGDVVAISGVLGNLAANGVWKVGAYDTTHITLVGSIGNGNYSTGGTVISGEFAIARMEDDGVTQRTTYITTSTPFRGTDIQIADNEFFALHSVELDAKAANTWGIY